MEKMLKRLIENYGKFKNCYFLNFVNSYRHQDWDDEEKDQNFINNLRSEIKK